MAIAADLHNNRECGSGLAEGCRQFGVPRARVRSGSDEVPYRLSKLQRLLVSVRADGRSPGKKTACPHPISQLTRRAEFIVGRMWRAVFDKTAEVQRVHELVQQRQLARDRISLGQPHATPIYTFCRLTPRDTV
jgi:hypothetical protein